MPLRFWIDEYAFSEGETAILRESINVRPASDPPVVTPKPESTFLLYCKALA